ncbi:lytic transglycosylase domain-containing protein [Massilia yuzhufengensis]|uniref:Soluble lytic murein transglycosylase n=1 Tax=Massilia yuzhufengensis TaxID=1164594 RepID=A0A1I1DRH0_9BURK|nr:lytic transglycosylase domain-containing protein [Massilia yuzhufengensis]SFB77609.1 soluble lytic murein transglycosylase [Massilia yuzhufengensis]
MFQKRLTTGALPAALALVLTMSTLPSSAAAAAPEAPPAAQLVPPVPAGAPAVPGASDARADDDTFLLLREAARQNDAARTNALASRLPNHALASYVDYYRLKPRLRDAPADEIREVLRRHEGSAVAEQLRTEWLLDLGRRRDWTGFEREVGQLARGDNLQVRCYALLARAGRGEQVAAEARTLLGNPAGYGEACAALVAQLLQSGQMNQEDVYWQLRLAGEADATGPARRLAALLGASETRAAQAVDVPAVAMARGIGATRAERAIYLVALGRMARTSLRLATVALQKNSPKLSAEERAIGWAGIAHAASIVLSPDAATYWQRANGVPLTNEQAQWKTRIALRRGDWKTVRATIEAMPPALRAESAWVYWLGRADKHEGRMVEANAAFERVATQQHFYGQLALDELGRQVVAPPPATPVSLEELGQAIANPSLQRALKFYSLRLRAEGNREWNWALRGMSDRQLLAAGELARRNDLLDRTVDTSLRTRTELDYAQRFPAPHLDLLHPTAQGLGLDKAWVYGLIRQESRFISDARSGVGASGLMQVMPATGKWVAGKIGMDNFVHGMLTDLRTNITLGANYMNMVLANFDGDEILATVAYNAGPSRARAWRGVLDAPMEGAIFVESIPFAETRGYVRNVLANATNYAAVFEQKPQSIRTRVRTVQPRERASILP